MATSNTRRSFDEHVKLLTAFSPAVAFDVFSHVYAYLEGDIPFESIETRAAADFS